MAWHQLAKGYTTTVATNGDEYFPSAGLYVPSRGATSLTLKTRRTADIGACTMDVYFQFLYTVIYTWHDLLDENDGTAITGVQYANDAWDTTGYRLLTIKEILPVGHTTGKKIYGTNYVSYQAPFIPEFVRARVRSGGTSVSNTFDMVMFAHHR